MTRDQISGMLSEPVSVQASLVASTSHRCHCCKLARRSFYLRSAGSREDAGESHSSYSWPVGGITRETSVHILAQLPRRRYYETRVRMERENIRLRTARSPTTRRQNRMRISSNGFIQSVTPASVASSTLIFSSLEDVHGRGIPGLSVSIFS